MKFKYLYKIIYILCSHPIKYDEIYVLRTKFPQNKNDLVYEWQ